MQKINTHTYIKHATIIQTKMQKNMHEQYAKIIQLPHTHCTNKNIHNTRNTHTHITQHNIQNMQQSYTHTYTNHTQTHTNHTTYPTLAKQT